MDQIPESSACLFLFLLQIVIIAADYIDRAEIELAPPQDKQSLSDSTTEFHDAPSTLSLCGMCCTMYCTKLKRKFISLP